MSERHEDPLVEVEAKLAHQEVLVTQLSDVIYQQQQRIDLLDRRVARLMERCKVLEAGSDAGQSQEDAPPPHY